MRSIKTSFSSQEPRSFWPAPQNEGSIVLTIVQSRTQTPSGFLVSEKAVGGFLARICQERLWGTGILLPQDFRGKTVEAVTLQPIKRFNVFRILHSLSWRPPADQKARGLWVRDCPLFGWPL